MVRKDWIYELYIQETLNRKKDKLKDDDFYYEGGKMIFTEAYHLKRGVCCNNGCKNCPFKVS